MADPTERLRPASTWCSTNASAPPPSPAHLGLAALVQRGPKPKFNKSDSQAEVIHPQMQ